MGLGKCPNRWKRQQVTRTVSMYPLLHVYKWHCRGGRASLYPKTYPMMTRHVTRQEDGDAGWLVFCFREVLAVSLSSASLWYSRPACNKEMMDVRVTSSSPPVENNVMLTKVIYVFLYLLKAYSPVNRTGSPRGFLQVQIVTNHISNIIHINTHKMLKIVSSILPLRTIANKARTPRLLLFLSETIIVVLGNNFCF